MRTEYPKISIITVVYNGEKTIEETIISVKNLSYSNIEYIIVDGCSTDKTIEIIKKNNDIVSKFLSEPDMGIYDAMNKAINLTTGDWIYFLGADDLIYDCLDDIIPSLKKDTIVYGNVLYRESNKKYGGIFNSFKFVSKNIPHQALFYPASVFEIYKFNLKYKFYADYYLNLQCWNDIKFKFKYVDIIVANYNDTGASSLNIDKAFMDDQLNIFYKTMPVYLRPYIYIRKKMRKLFNYFYE